MDSDCMGLSTRISDHYNLVDTDICMKYLDLCTGQFRMGLACTDLKLDNWRLSKVVGTCICKMNQKLCIGLRCCMDLDCTGHGSRILDH